MPQNNDPKVEIKVVIVPLIIAGLAYCFYASGLWPSIPYVVDKQVLGSAYGITTAIQNAGLALGPILVASVTNDNVEGHNYRMVNLIQMGEGFLGLIFGVLLWIYDVRKGKGVLSLDSVEAARMYYYYK